MGERVFIIAVNIRGFFNIFSSSECNILTLGHHHEEDLEWKKVSPQIVFSEFCFHFITARAAQYHAVAYLWEWVGTRNSLGNTSQAVVPDVTNDNDCYFWAKKRSTKIISFFRACVICGAALSEPNIFTKFCKF